MLHPGYGGPLLAALGLASVHLFSQKLRMLDGIPRNRFLSVAGGMAVAFVFLRLLPAVAVGQDTLAEASAGTWLERFERHAFAAALLSLFVFYLLEHLARVSKANQRERGAGAVTTHGVFWLHMGTFGVMNVLIGYLLIHNRERSHLALVLFFLAMMLKFIVNDHALHRDHKHRYDNLGRYLLAGAVLLGVAVRLIVRLPEPVPVLLQAVLAGAVLLNVLKEEIPDERQASLGAFLGGGVAYAALLLVT